MENCQFIDNGNYTVTLYVTTNESDIGNCSKIIRVRNVHPCADFQPKFSVVLANETVNFTDYSTDIDGYIEGWFWDFGDNMNATTQNASHSYQSSLEQQILLL